ncbi:hypothetical protein FIBSPDRAFT_897872 [Athelia psychrophila]|uniref:Coenzyme Q-binding protein COQ10 START domain-containing protein n=1 Tax=Athelia psychrophila TaxID=1759441 RepID=A0A166BQG5_9AGAM|nr:hypothetical protein FIBSPDRAFT_897872 [Fibularhizoctonia sp. CBS 109695]
MSDNSSSNLPPKASDGVFAVSVSSVINAPRDKVWKILIDFPAYHEWNPFVRALSIVSKDSSQTPLRDEVPTAGAHLLMSRVHIPPTMDDASVRSPSSSLERITVLDHENYRCAWVYISLPTWLLKAERWQMLTVVNSGEGEGEVTKYESIEVFGGILAYVVKFFVRSGLVEGFQAMTDSLKQRAEA